MPRTARIRAEGLPVHITQRGHNKDPCFFEEADYRLFLGLLAELSPTCGCAVHAYVLMTNHVHLLLTAEDAWGFTRLMRHVNQRYVQYVNRHHGRCGSIWQGRFWSSLVETEGYLLTCQRYIELNPLRAGMVLHPADYPWSSYACNARGAPSPLVRQHAVYLGLGGTEADRRARYRELFDAGFDPSELARIRDAIRASRPIGSESFLDGLEASLGVRARRGKPGRQAASLDKGEIGVPLLI